MPARSVLRDAPAIDHEGERDRHQRSDQRRHLPESCDAAASAIVGGEFSAPGDIGQIGHGEGHRERRRPDEEVAKTGIGRRREQHVGADRRRHDGDGQRHAPAAKARSKIVRGPSDDGIGDGIDQPDGDQHPADRSERQADHIRVEGRHDDVERQSQCRERQRRQRVGRQRPDRYAIGNGRQASGLLCHARHR